MFELSWQRIMLWGSFIFFLGAVLLRQETGINQDLGRHLRLGAMIAAGADERKCALFTNCLTYTYPDYPFVNHHWGSEVLFFVAYKFGGFPLLIIFKSIILALTFAITVRHSSQQVKSEKLKVKSLAIAMAATFFSIQMMADRLTTRPEIFGYLLFSLLFWLLDKKDLPNWRNLANWMAIPIIMILWVNLHISFVFGLILVWLWAGSKILNTEFRILNDKPGNAKPSAIQNSVFRIQYLKFLAIPVISTVVTIFNPAGLRGALMPFSIMKDYGYTIVENMTPFFLRAFKPQPEYWIYVSLAAITFILALLTGKLGKFAGLVLLVFSIFPLIAVRHLPFFALVMPVVLTPLLVRILKGPTLAYAKVGPYHAPVVVAGGLFLATVINPVPLAYAKLPDLGLTADRRHEQAVKFVENHDLQGKMWNNYDIGSFLEWSLPEYPTFVDGRPEAFPAGFFQEIYIPMQQSREKWDEVVRTNDIQWVLAALTDATPWFQKWRQMISKHEGWKIVYIDNATAILIRQ